MTEQPLLKTELKDRVGVITLNRPGALNALNADMVAALHGALDAWEDLQLDAVVINSSNSRSFCAGGDIKKIRELVLRGDGSDGDAFFATEYEFNHRLATYPAPVVSLIEGLCLGGGLGLSAHGRFRVVTETAVMAMPETAIGFFPDVGATHFLSRLPGAIGMYLGLTGHRMDYRDALYCGLATHFVPAERLGDLVELLEEAAGRPVAQVIADGCTRPPDTGGHLSEHRAEIDWCFGAGSLDGIRQRLLAQDNDWSRSVCHLLRGASPQSLETTYGLLSLGSQLSLQQGLAVELHLAGIVIRSDDFAEGVRAALVDKDRNPVWSSDPAMPFTHLRESVTS